MPGRALSALLLAGAVVCACADGASGPPDVILIDVEGLRTDHLSHTGYARPTASGLDRLREQAALFSHARASSSAGPTGTASLLTGLSPERHRVTGAKPRIASGQQTLAEILRAAGWHTAALSHHSGISREAGFAQGFDRFEAATGDLEKYPDAEAMVAWLREWLANEPPRPVLLYLHPMNAHAPYRVPQKHRSRLLGRHPSPALPWGGDLMRAAQKPGRWRARQAIREVHVRSLVEQYDTAVRYTLDRVGEMLSMLEQTGHFENAIVVVTSNHGEELFDHQGFGAGRTLHEELLRVPLYLKLPGSHAATSFDQPVSIQDVVPTLLDLLDVEAPRTDGISLAPLLRGEATELPERDFVHDLDMPEQQVQERALVRGRFKLIDARRRANGTHHQSLLYDLALDPTEQHDLAPESPEIVSELRAELVREFRD